MTDRIYSVGITTNMMTCRLCGGRGRDPYSYGQSCRKCGGHKRYPTPAASAARVAWNKWKSDNVARLEADEVTEEEVQAFFRDAIEFIDGLRGAKAKVVFAADDDAA